MMLANVALIVVMPALFGSVMLTFIRLIKGPTTPDRVIAADLMATIGIGVIAVYAIMTNQPTFLDVAIILALISFLGTIAFAYYVEKGQNHA